jgi:serine-type D-Ala-D-Ala carboxypeptidase (penicillin-binding protein 5/6)
MRKLVASLLLVVPLAVVAAIPPRPTLPPVPTPQMSPLPARAYVLMDFKSGRVLVEKQPHAHMAPASTTKLMTAYIVLQELKAGRIHLDTKFPVSNKAWHQDGSRMFLKPGSQVSVGELLQGLLVPSGNDAAVTLAQGIAGTTDSFVGLMNGYAQRLGLHDTHYTDVTGLPAPEHYTSAMDLAKLSRAIIRQFPGYYHYFSEKEFSWNHIKQSNFNKLLWLDPTVDGLKTGYTSEAGYCLAASAKRGNTRMIAVIMGANEPKATSAQNYINLARVNDALLNYGFQFYKTRQLYKAGQVLAHSHVWDGAKGTLSLGPAKPLYVTYPSGRYADLKANMHLPDKLTAPIHHGQKIGEVVIRMGTKVMARVPLVALDDDPTGSLWQRTRDTVLQWFK